MPRLVAKGTLPGVLFWLIGWWLPVGCVAVDSGEPEQKGGGSSGRSPVEDQKGIDAVPPAGHPLNAFYRIEGNATQLEEGIAEEEAAPGSATKVRTSVFGDPVYGDLEGDGDLDAGLILVRDPGGSGTFYYIAAALNSDGRFSGTNALLLGDRITPQNVNIRNGTIVVSCADRLPEEPMSATPSVGRSRHLILRKRQLVAAEPLTENEQVVEGWVTIGHEVRSFIPCTEKEELWLLGSSPALPDVMMAYREALQDPEPYTPLFMTLAGAFVGAPNDGFGEDYAAAFSASQMIRAWRQGNCKGELIYATSPLPWTQIDSPLTIQGHARGSWFFEGDFPVVLLSLEGEVIARGFCTALGEWMTQEFVPFKGSLEFTKPSSGDRSTLVLKKTTLRIFLSMTMRWKFLSTFENDLKSHFVDRLRPCLETGARDFALTLRFFDLRVFDSVTQVAAYFDAGVRDKENCKEMKVKPVSKRDLGQICCVLVLGVVACGGCGQPPVEEVAAVQSEERFVTILDGETFTGWEGDLEWFRIEDGAIVGGSLEKDIPHNVFLATEQEYDDFELRLQVRLIGDLERANAGIQIRSRRAPEGPEMIGYQADMGQQYWGCLYDESRRNKVLAEADVQRLAEVLKPGDWNEYVIRCQGKQIQLWINGLQTIDFTESDPGIEGSGLIGLQIHSGPPSQAWYKDIQLRPIESD